MARKSLDGASWGCSGDNSTLAGTFYLVTHPHLPGQPSQGQPDTFHSSWASSQIYFFLNNPARFWNSTPAAHHCSGLHLIPPSTSVLAQVRNFMNRLSSASIHNRWRHAGVRWLPALPAPRARQLPSALPWAAGCVRCLCFIPRD